MNEDDSGSGAHPRGRPKRPRPRFDERAPKAGPRREPGPDDSESRQAEEKLSKISGLAAVTALFRRDPERVVRLYYSDAMKLEAGPFCAKTAEMRRIYRLVGEDELARVAGTMHHGGIVAAARVRPVPPLELEDVERWARRSEPLVMLDGVGNPHNLGAIARTLAFFSIRRLVISGHQAQAGLSDAAYRVAEGGLEYLDLYQVPHLPSVLKRLREHYRVIGTAVRGGRPFEALPPDPRPVCLVFGNEGQGLPAATLRACESLVTIPGSGAVQSLNVSATAAILVSRLAHRAGPVRRQRPRPTRPKRPRPS